MNILYLANSLPYDTVKHAGGKTFNYYVTNLGRNPQNKIKVIGICKAEERKEIRPKGSNVELIPVITMGTPVLNLKRVAFDIAGKLFHLPKCDESFYKFHIISQALNAIDFNPEVVILEWTNMVLLWETVKKRFPNAKIVASEHDVSYLGLERKGLPPKELAAAKAAELNALKACDVVMPHNIKDRDLLIHDGIEPQKLHTIVPYFHNMSHIQRKSNNRDILFWGAMNRPDNYEAAIWFIEKVMPLLSDLPVRFVVAGNRPPEQLLKYSSERVVITGFVEDEAPLFESSMCFVSPLLTGAGIKVKVIEALSAGIPILTNTIGIEGIPAVDGESYFHCETPEAYAEVIRKIYYGEVDLCALRQKQDNVIKEHFHLETSAQSYVRMIESL